MNDKKWYGLKIDGVITCVLKSHNVPDYERFRNVFGVPYFTTSKMEVCRIKLTEHPETMSEPLKI